jgi:uncharacterized membrane protein (DUF485 family)
MSNPENFDPTPLSGGETDVSRLGQTGPKPEHEKTAVEDNATSNWDAIAATPGFAALLKAKARFIVPASVFFVVYYFALPVLVGFFPELMKTKIGPANLAYLFALSQFFVAWIIAILYTRTASKWDKQSADLIAAAPKQSSK